MKKILSIMGVIILVAIVVAAAFIIAKPKAVSNDQPIGKVDFKDATYLIDGQAVTLKNGLAEMETVVGAAAKTTTRYFGNEAAGDLNGDGSEDVAFLLTQESGGSGTFYYLAAAVDGVWGYQGLNTILLGDRIAPQTTEINAGTIIVNYADRKAGEPMSADQTLGVSKYFQVINNQLVPAREPTQTANPASVNCQAKGGTLEIRTNKIGEYGVCLFEDNRQCEEWALLREQCPVGGLKITGYENEAQAYCAITGGTVEGLGTETPMCKRVDGTLCSAQANFDGACPDPNDPNPSAGNREAP
jgi:putative hemolysin